MSGELSRPSYCTGYHSRPLYCSNTGSIALRLAEVQPPKTVATLSTVMSCFAFSAKVGQSEAPSWVTTWSCLPSTPPAALTSSIARSSAFFTATSLMAIVPLSEWRSPTLMMEPATPGIASEPEPADAVPVGVPACVAPVTFFPHADATSASRQSSVSGSNPYRCCERACFKIRPPFVSCLSVSLSVQCRNHGYNSGAPGPLGGHGADVNGGMFRARFG